MKCPECQAITEELLEAYAEAWDSGGPALREAWSSVYKMIGGTEEDAARAEELIPLVRNPSAHRIHLALQRKVAHQALAGHKVPIEPAL
jgi:hypothetical protein